MTPIKVVLLELTFFITVMSVISGQIFLGFIGLILVIAIWRLIKLLEEK